MDTLKDKIRPLTSAERRSLASKGLYLSSLKQESLEEAIYNVLDIVFKADEIKDLTMEEEVELYNAIFDKTYNLSKEEAGN